MSLATQIAALATRIGNEIKSLVRPSHPGVAKAWVCFGYVGSQIVIRSAFNVSGVMRTAAGRYRVTFSLPLPDENYCWQAVARSSVNTGTQRIAIVRSTADQKTAQFVDVCCATTASTFTDSTEINLTVFH